MEGLNEIIDGSRDPREVKRALSVKMAQGGISPKEIMKLLNVSAQYVSKWKVRYEQEGAEGLRLGYRGSTSYLSPSQREEIIKWIQKQDLLSVEGVRDHIQEEYGILYRSKQSYYQLLSEAGMSYHRTTPVNPKRDESRVGEKRKEIKKKWQLIKRR